MRQERWTQGNQGDFHAITPYPDRIFNGVFYEVERQTMETLIESLKRGEGFKDRVYLDTKGNPTCGWGHHLYEGSKVPMVACEAFFRQDVAIAVAEFAKLPKGYRDKLNATRRRVVVEMIFNMKGLKSVMGFVKFWRAVLREDWEEAEKQMLDSKWHREDVGIRAERLAKIFREG